MMQLMGLQLMVGIIVVGIGVVIIVITATVVVIVVIAIVIVRRLSRVVDMWIKDARGGSIHRADELNAALADHAQHL